MRCAALLIALPLAGCQTTLSQQPAAQAALLGNPGCAAFCKVQLVVQRFDVKAEGGGTVTASPDLSVALKQSSDPAQFSGSGGFGPD